MRGEPRYYCILALDEYKVTLFIGVHIIQYFFWASHICYLFSKKLLNTYYWILYRHNGRWKHLEGPLGSHLEKNILLLSWQQNGGNSSLWPLNTLTPWSPAPPDPLTLWLLGPLSSSGLLYWQRGRWQHMYMKDIFSYLGKKWVDNGTSDPWPPIPSGPLAPLAPLFHRPCCINLAFKENPHQ